MFKRILRRVLRQNVSIRRWGAFKQTVGQIGIYVTFINTVMLSVTLYSTRWVQDNVINISFIGFMAVVFGVIGLLLLLAWKMDMPSYFSSWNHQFWKHDNPMKDYLDEQFKGINKRLEELEKGNSGNDTPTP